MKTEYLCVVIKNKKHSPPFNPQLEKKVRKTKIVLTNFF